MKISKSEFAARRKRLMAEMAPNSVAIIPAAREVTRSRDTEYPSVKTAISFTSQASKSLTVFLYSYPVVVRGR